MKVMGLLYEISPGSCLIFVPEVLHSGEGWRGLRAPAPALLSHCGTRGLSWMIAEGAPLPALAFDDSMFQLPFYNGHLFFFFGLSLQFISE